MTRSLIPYFLVFAVLTVTLMSNLAQVQAQKRSPSTAEAVEQAHARLQAEFIDRYGIVNDYLGERPTPEDCRLGRPNAIGWWSPIENGPMFTGLYLVAICERAKRTGDDSDRQLAKRLAQGLMKCASVSDVNGFIARGVGTDGQCHYPLSSDDQVHPWFLGLHAYLISGLPDEAERIAIATKYQQVAEALELLGWRVPCDGAFLGQHRGSYRGHLFRDAVRYLYLLRAAYEVTGDKVWITRYQQCLPQRPEGSQFTRLEICAGGYPQDRTAIQHLDEHQLWIYVGCQASLKQLVRMELNESAQAKYQAGLQINAQEALPELKKFAEFDNHDTKKFGNADWRAVYDQWSPQTNQQAAEQLASKANQAKRGERKAYEARLMRNPLAAASIVALANEAKDRPVIEAAIGHYDYSRLNMAEFFFAELAYYASSSH